MRDLEKIFKKGRELWVQRPRPNIEEMLLETDYTIEDIAKFAQEKLESPEQEHFIGYELSMFINAKITEHDKVTLKTRPGGYNCKWKGTDWKIEGLGYMLKRGELTIIGDTGNNTGEKQKGGTLIIKGDTGNHTGEEQRGGTLIVKGNTGNRLSEEKWGGKTIVEGNAGEQACYCMKGGMTRVMGNIGTCEWMQGGVLIVDGKIQRISRFTNGIIIENKEVREIYPIFDSFRLNPLLDEQFPEELAVKALVAYAKENGFWYLKDMVRNRALEYRARLRMLDQELPIIIKKIGEPEKKLAALKALEEEARANPTKEVLQLARHCGAEPGSPTEEYNYKIKEKMKRHKKMLKRYEEKTEKCKKEIKELEKEFL